MDIPDPFALCGTVLNGKYRIERCVAEGGFGVVYRGMHLSLEKRIALKVLKLRQDVGPKLRASIATKFRREAQTLAKLNHPALVQALDLDVSVIAGGAEAPWMVLEWIEGPSLKAWLRERPGGPAMSPGQALELLAPVFEALGCAHDEGIAHRDIKPSNIMVDTRRNQQLRLMDFGIAKLMEEGQAAAPSLENRTISEFPMYSARYAAPEQALGRTTGPWTDVHALGLLLTEVLVGGSAYRERESALLLGETLGERRPTPGHQLPPVDVGPWEPVIARALHRNPSERYPNASEFLAALENTLPGANRKRPGAEQVSPGVPITAVHGSMIGSTPTHGNPVVRTPPSGHEVVPSLPRALPSTPSVQPVGSTSQQLPGARTALGVRFGIGALILLGALSLGIAVRTVRSHRIPAPLVSVAQPEAPAPAPVPVVATEPTPAPQEVTAPVVPAIATPESASDAGASENTSHRHRTRPGRIRLDIGD